MTRVEFTYNICQLLIEMFKADESPIIDYVKRSDEEQMHLYQEGKSKCDGIHNISKHQRGKAVDIYFVDGNKLVEPKLGHEYWHKRWTETYGGQSMISWDKGHFE